MIKNKYAKKSTQRLSQSSASDFELKPFERKQQQGINQQRKTRMKKSVFQVITVVIPLLSILSGCSTVGTPYEAGASAIVVTVLDKDTHSWNGKLLPAYPKGQPEVTVLRISIPPKTRLRTHRHPVINAAVLISGRLTVKTLDGQTLNLKAGDPLIEVVNTWHYGINPGKVPADIIVFYAGEVGTPITIFQTQPVADKETGNGVEPRKTSVTAE